MTTFIPKNILPWLISIALASCTNAESRYEMFANENELSEERELHIFKKLKKANESLKSAINNYDKEISYSLLDYDETSSDEEILGSSFNIPYASKNEKKKKFIPGNRIHKQLAWYNNQFRKAFYKEDGAYSHFYRNLDASEGKKSAYSSHCNDPNPHLFSEHYDCIEKNIVQAQNILKEEKKKFKIELKRSLYNSAEEIQKLKESLSYRVDKQNICLRLSNYAVTSKEFSGDEVILVTDQPSQMYTKKIEPPKKNPNFALARLSYITDDKMFCLPPMQLESSIYNNGGHAEFRVLHCLKSELEKCQGISENFKYCDLVILDLHTTMSMCNGRHPKENQEGPKCHLEAKKILDDAKSWEILKDKSLKIRVSYNFPYYTPINSRTENLIHQQIEIVNERPLINNIVFSPDHLIFSSSNKSTKATRFLLHLLLIEQLRSFGVLNEAKLKEYYPSFSEEIKQREEDLCKKYKENLIESKIEQESEKYYNSNDIKYLLETLFKEAPQVKIIMTKKLYQLEENDILAIIRDIAAAIVEVDQKGKIVLMPMNLYDNHWAGAVFKKQSNLIRIFYNDPKGDVITLQQHILNFSQILSLAAQALKTELFLIDLAKQQQYRDCDSGPYTVFNLKQLVYYNDINWSGSSIRNEYDSMLATEELNTMLAHITI